ncbi:hypothetical protein PMO31116_04111 [Pandoraea morbifera]|uniref:Type II toxin-antitoxin system RelE/ParE family toxin n=2 Tax=Pandoraea TaxID=93217 RepID=A0A379KD48_9BURK|nr:hypothetical protein X636_20605 [Pandoraea pnomenusa]SUD65830.1 Uncharacterised protein [Pandoraea pnomenusa]VVE40830.1 hypothetical protein PMO31116_04111 [Pandoraea morbifera]
MTRVRLHREANEDIQKIKLTSQKDAAMALLIVRGLIDDPSPLEHLTTPDTIWPGLGFDYEVTQFQFFHKRGHDVWRIKAYDAPGHTFPYRLIYFYDIEAKDFYIVAVVHRSLDYENDPDTCKRIRELYKRLGLKVH